MLEDGEDANLGRGQANLLHQGALRFSMLATILLGTGLSSALSVGRREGMIGYLL